MAKTKRASPRIAQNVSSNTRKWKEGTHIESSEAAAFEPTDLDTAIPKERALKVRAKAVTFLADNPAVATPCSIVDQLGNVAFCSTSPLVWAQVTGEDSCAAEALCCATGGDTRKWKREKLWICIAANKLLTRIFLEGEGCADGHNEPRDWLQWL